MTDNQVVLRLSGLRVLGIVLILLGTLLWMHFVLVGTTSIFSVWFLLRWSAPFMATVGLLLFTQRPKMADSTTTVMTGLGIGLCVQGLFPLLWIMFFGMYVGDGLEINQLFGMFFVGCFATVTPTGVLCVVFGIIQFARNLPVTK